MNLCINASHALQDQKGIIEVHLEEICLSPTDAMICPELKPGRYVKLAVSDTGQGMNPEVRSRIFEPYFTTKEQGKGTGLGLSIVHGIVKSHQGHISVYSEPQKGTVFHIYIPAQEESTPAEDFCESEIPMPTGNECILLIDDEPINLQMETRMLEMLGYSVTPLSSSREALKTFGENPKLFDLVITDMNMPHMTGMELAQELIRRNPEIPIILCSGFNEMILKEKSEIIGIRAFVAKPISIRSIAESIRGVLENSHTGKKDENKSVHNPEGEKSPEVCVNFTYLDSVFSESEEKSGIIHTFLEDAPSRIRNMESAIDENNPEILEMEAHSLKTMSAYFGAAKMSELCKNLEYAGHTKLMERVSETFGSLKDTYEQVESALKLEINA
jgi:CheY-like chemotaxis protein/HPt (histidine-containing phosphotransfer) domain-containing protein